MTAVDTRCRRLILTAVDPRIGLLVAFFLIVLATNAEFFHTNVDDGVDYRQMAAAAPGLPSHPIASAFTGRFAIHYLVGLIAYFAGLSLDEAYILVWAVLMAALLLTIYALFRWLAVGDFALCTALFVLNPYTLRPYILHPDMLQDLVFVLGLCVCLIGLRKQSTLGVLVGLVVAVLGRQTAIAVAPIVAAWIVFDPAWRKGSSRRIARLTASAALASTFVIFVGVKAWTRRFSLNFEPSVLHNSILNRIIDQPDAAQEIAIHFARTAVPLVVPVMVLLSVITVVGRRHLDLTFLGEPADRGSSCRTASAGRSGVLRF